MSAQKEHLQIGTVHFYFQMCEHQEGCEHVVEIRYPGYKHTILHAESDLKQAKIHAIDMAVKLGLITLEDASEALSVLV